ncbi:NAD(P)H-hydrate dehydratase [Maribellus luteus]|uniref:Bifunctional NAD(P)H-hydrate repair enzyme n=1 Tax=Maribellus luteus TaxID=2305463 RepID=A0A399SQ41_9BACT|nr:NAD(P)H-hydrate dehydratase [Maribellus luteus]RIJ46126.1 NAD(P)H-hydrate dehydratase [Maribellus luteus]
MKLFSTQQIAQLDQYTIQHEPIADIDLMERASLQITNWIVQHFSAEQRMMLFAGPGNNGGDALAIARQLAGLDYLCEVYLLDFEKELKGSPSINWQRLEEQGLVKLSRIRKVEDFPVLQEGDVVLDGLFGSGLSRPLEGFPAEVVDFLNQATNSIIAIDIPSGLMGEDNTGNTEHIIRADFTLTFQFPKISFLLAENEQYLGRWKVLPIGLHPDGIEKEKSLFHWLEKEEVQKMIPVRSKFEHKGTLGHALLIAGSFGKMGAAVLASKACLRGGVGLLTTHIPRLGYSILQTAVPEAMASVDQHDSVFTEFPKLEPYSAIGVGPGLDQKQNTRKALCALLESAKVPLVIDADALNILSLQKEWLEKLPEGSVLTPHPGEFRRLVGETENSYQNIQKQLEFSKKYRCVVVLKGACTSISLPDGRLFFNSTGNPGMATAGSGDVLTGVILGLLAQRMSPEDAALTGVFLHGLAGDMAAKKRSEFSLIAGDLVEEMGKAFRKIIN